MPFWSMSGFCLLYHFLGHPLAQIPHILLLNNVWIICPHFCCGCWLTVCWKTAEWNFFLIIKFSVLLQLSYSIPLDYVTSVTCTVLNWIIKFVLSSIRVQYMCHIWLKPQYCHIAYHHIHLHSFLLLSCFSIAVGVVSQVCYTTGNRMLVWVV